ncbi:MAG: NAD(+) synthase [Acetivibrio ethanolgignens]
MKQGFVKVAAATPKVRVADCKYNADKIIKIIEEGEKERIRLLVFPELCITGYTCGDLFLQNRLLRSAREELLRIAGATKDKELLAVVGLPFLLDGKLYNMAAVLYRGGILGLVPKTAIPNYSEYYEGRHFTPGFAAVRQVKVGGKMIPAGTRLLFACRELPDFVLGVEICEDIWVTIPPSSYHAMAGATVIANLSASNEAAGKGNYRKDLIKGQSAKAVCGYIYADAGDGESTTDVVFSAHNMIAENGSLLAEAERFKNKMAVSELDLEKLISERQRISTYVQQGSEEYQRIEFSWEIEKTELTRVFEKRPFVPDKKEIRDKVCDEILSMQAMGLKKRLEHTGCSQAVIGISGGLDSTLALLVTVRAFDALGLSREGIVAVTMPCFGTTDRTYQNALILAEELHTSLREVRINAAVEQHFKDICHDGHTHDVAYENSQARERTQVLMDIANACGGMVIGTGDMSELALGWATYNGDHMSMYGVNASVPKTLVRYLVSYYAEATDNEALRSVLYDVLDTPVSPELLPPKEGEIAQKTEDIVGPYELHDFYLYYMLRYGYEPEKIYRMAVETFDGIYNKKTVYKWLYTFYRRFFAQQYKRSCLPDGPKVGSVSLSPRGDLRMPSDACVALWLEQLEGLSVD